MLNLDLSGAKENSFAPLPEGKYAVIVDDAKICSTKAGDGSYIMAVMRVLHGAHEGRKLFATFNIQNKSEQAQQIGLGQLKTFLRVAGHKDPNVLTDVLDMVGYKATATVKIKDDKNNISYFKEYSKPEEPKEAAPF